VHHVALADAARAAHGLERPAQAEARTSRFSSAACETKVIEVRSASPNAPNIGR
jgi:hypothetical protein